MRATPPVLIVDLVVARTAERYGGGKFKVGCGHCWCFLVRSYLLWEWKAVAKGFYVVSR